MLTVQKVRSLKKPGRYGDGGNLWLQVSTSGTKSWLFRYSRNSKAHHFGLGSVELVSLAEAREKAIDLRRALLNGIDPLSAKHELRARAASALSFRGAAERYVDKHRSEWRSQ